MRVLYVEFATGFGGSLTALLDTVNALGRDIDPILVIPYDPSPYCPIPSNLEVRVVTPPALSLRDSRNVSVLTRYVPNTMSWVRLLDEVVREVRPDLIHANNMSSMNLAAGIVGRRHGVPVVSHQRGAEYPGWPNWLVIKGRLYSHHIAVWRAIVPPLTRLGLAESLCTVIYDPIPVPPPPSNRLRDCFKNQAKCLFSRGFRGRDPFLKQFLSRLHQGFTCMSSRLIRLSDSRYQ